VVGPGWAEFAAASGWPSVVMPGIVGHDQPQMPLAEDQHPVGDLGPALEAAASTGYDVVVLDHDRWCGGATW
jgi:hypothetical protein